MRGKVTIADIPADQDLRWGAVARRDPAFDGQFYYGVRTTGVYCRPSCQARAAKPGNVRYFATCDEAERAGFRPCKRCHPDEPTLKEKQTMKVVEICRDLATRQETPSLGEMARKAGISVYHFHRMFKSITGQTPGAYARAQRAQRVREELASRRSTVTGAIYGAGFNSSGRFYECSNNILGMTPADYRDGGKGIEIRFAVGECSLGSILVAMSTKGVCAILIGDDPDALTKAIQDRFPNAHLIGGDAQFEEAIAKVIGLVEAPSVGLDLPLDLRGTAFQQRVWQALRQIPPGTTASYEDIAKRIGAPKSVRAVAGAVAANPLAVAIPCHRVVRKDGSLGGYRWGVARKRALLEREARSQGAD